MRDADFQGEIIDYYEARGFGFIAPDDGGGDLFFHVRDVRDADGVELGAGLRVAFQRGLNPKNGRLRAFEIHLTGAP